MNDAPQLLARLTDNIGQAIVGKQGLVHLMLIALLSKGHVLIEDVPGVGKTSLVLAMARSVGCSFNRIQFTPDVTPSDVVGFSVFNRRTEDFSYKQGAVFCQFLLADEINRTSAKTQSSLLEVMGERQVTVDSVTYPLPAPFMVFATQNPVEYVGTYPLPEAQMDRFFLRLRVGYPDTQEEMAILNLHRQENPAAQLTPIADPAEILRLQELAGQVHMSSEVAGYIVTLCQQTRRHPHLQLGASPRGSISLSQAARAHALLQNRDYVTPEDVQRMAVPVLAHRLQLTQEAKFRNIRQETVVSDIVKSTAVNTAPSNTPVNAATPRNAGGTR